MRISLLAGIKLRHFRFPLYVIRDAGFEMAGGSVKL
jgi:hypothetical protein